MHPAAIQLAKDVHEKYLKGKGYRFVAKTFRYEFSGGFVVSRFRGCSKFNRLDAPRWRFQIGSRILFDDLEYDPQRWPVCTGSQGDYSGGVYEIETIDQTTHQRIAEDICRLTDRLLSEREIIRAAFIARLLAKRERKDNRWAHVPRQMSEEEKAELYQWAEEYLEQTAAKEKRKRK